MCPQPRRPPACAPMSSNTPCRYVFKRTSPQPWPAWLRWLGIIPHTERSRVWFPVRVRAWVVGSVLGQVAYKRQTVDVSLSHQCFSPCLSPSLPLSLKSTSMSWGEDKRRNKPPNTPQPQSLKLLPGLRGAEYLILLEMFK